MLDILGLTIKIFYKQSNMQNSKCGSVDIRCNVVCFNESYKTQASIPCDLQSAATI